MLKTDLTVNRRRRRRFNDQSERYHGLLTSRKKLMNQWDNKTNSPLNMKVKFAVTTTVCYAIYNVKDNSSSVYRKLIDIIYDISI